VSAKKTRKPARTPRSEKPAAPAILPMELRVGAHLCDETGEYEVIGRPYTTAGGKTANVRVKRVESDTTMIRVWGAHERVAVQRGGVRWRHLSSCHGNTLERSLERWPSRSRVSLTTYARSAAC